MRPRPLLTAYLLNEKVNLLATNPSAPPAPEQISAWTGERSFALGQRAYRTGALRRPRRRGATLLGLCQGSLVEPYRVEVTLAAGGDVASAICTCGYGAEGRCKHVAALLVAWAEDPGGFAAAEDLDTTLDHLSKESLLLLVRRLMHGADDLVAQVERELPFVTGEVASAERVNIEALRREALTALGAEQRAHYDDWPERGDGETDPLRARLQPLLDLGRDYRASRRYALAAAVYRALAQTVIESYDGRGDPVGQRRDALRGIVRTCSSGLNDCLAGTGDAGPRWVVLRALVSILVLGRDEGVDDGGLARETVLAQMDPHERAFAAEQIRAALPPGATPEARARRQQFGDLLLALTGAETVGEARLSLYRETGQTRALVVYLLDAGRTDEAIAAADTATDVADLLPLLDALEEHGQGEAAWSVAHERLRGDQDARLARWLHGRAVRRGDDRQASELADLVFQLDPSVETYRDVRRAAERAGTWAETRENVRERLAREGRHTLLAELCLDDGDLDAALDAFEHADAESASAHDDAGAGGDPLAARLAAAAESTRPDDAVRLYREEAARLIARGGRQRFALAATYLARVKDLLLGAGRSDEWERLIGDIRAAQGERRGLAHELRRAAL